jgi:hypothetical protein
MCGERGTTGEGGGAGSAWGGRPRELANWQYIAIGGAAGAMASVATMPMDVLKTRIMTASAGAASPAIGPS